MSVDSKPIRSQPGGRGKLFSPASGGTYEGTYCLPNGKFDRRRFKQPTRAKAVAAYEQWCAEMDERVRQAMVEAVRPKATSAVKQEEREPAAMVAGRKEETVAASKASTAKAGDGDGKIYVVMVVGGVAVAWCDTFDKAAAVCDGLTAGAKASGFAATYDVMEVKKWTA